MRPTALPPAVLALAALVTAPAAAGAPETAAWDAVVRRHVAAGGVDYAGLAADRAALDRFLASLAGVDVEALERDERLAFWINAYNAVVVHFVLERYPGLRSVREVEGFFDRQTFPVAGQPRTLDEIETAARELGDPRVHFAVVCASTSCPDLRPEAYTGARLAEQLAEQTTRFLADPAKGLRYDEAANELHLSSIFRWYAGDFTGGSTAVAFLLRGGVRDWVIEQLPRETGERLAARSPAIVYLDYDWTLNDR